MLWSEQVFANPLISESSSPFTKLLGIIPSATIIIGIIFAFFFTSIIILIVTVIINYWFLTSTIANSLSKESESQKVSAKLQDTSEYSNRTHQCRGLDVVVSFFNFQFLKIFSETLATVIHEPNAVSITGTLKLYSFFLDLLLGLKTCILLRFLLF